MFTATITDKQFDKGVAKITVEYTNGTDTFSEVLATGVYDDPQWVEKRVENKLAQLNGVKAYVDTISVGAVSSPTPVAQADKQIFLDKVGLLHKYKTAVRLGIMNEDATVITDLIADIKATYQSDYLQDLFG